VTQIYHRLFDQFRILDSEAASRSDDFAGAARWLELPGCLFQRNDVVLDSKIPTEGVIRPGLFVSVVLQGSGQGGPRRGKKPLRNSENTIVVMALRRPMPGVGETPSGARMFAAGLAFPMSSIDRLGLQQEFLDLFSEEGADEFVPPPRILAMATEMLSPTLKGRAEELLLSAHAMEILARVISIAGQRARAWPCPTIISSSGCARFAIPWMRICGARGKSPSWRGRPASAVVPSIHISGAPSA
jgi:hypothetical protein